MRKGSLVGVLPLLWSRKMLCRWGKRGRRKKSFQCQLVKENIEMWTLGAQLDLVAVSVVSYHITVLGNFSDQNCNVCKNVDVGRDSVKSLLT